jgi:hypothetical protein
MGKVLHTKGSGSIGPSTLWKYTATNYADLLTKSGMVEGDLAIVYNSQGVWLVNRKLKGVYMYQSGVWNYANQELQDKLEQTEYKVKVSSSDTTGDYLFNKTQQSSDLFKTISNPSGDEKLGFGLFDYNKVWSAVAEPTSGDDNSIPKRHRIGQIWFARSTGKFFIAKSLLTGAAVWIPIPVNEALKTKAGEVLNVSFAGIPKRASVVFTTPFADNNYSVSLTPNSLINSTYNPKVDTSTKTASGFTISMSTNNITNLTSCMWVAIKHGEN